MSFTPIRARIPSWEPIGLGLRAPACPPHGKTLEKKLANLPLHVSLPKFGDNWLAEIADSEGNFLELTAPVLEA